MTDTPPYKSEAELKVICAEVLSKLQQKTLYKTLELTRLCEIIATDFNNTDPKTCKVSNEKRQPESRIKEARRSVREQIEEFNDKSSAVKSILEDIVTTLRTGLQAAILPPEVLAKIAGKGEPEKPLYTQQTPVKANPISRAFIDEEIRKERLDIPDRTLRAMLTKLDSDLARAKSREETAEIYAAFKEKIHAKECPPNTLSLFLRALDIELGFAAATYTEKDYTAIVRPDDAKFAGRSRSGQER